MLDGTQTMGKTPLFSALLSGMAERIYEIQRDYSIRRCNEDVCVRLFDDLGVLKKDISRAQSRIKKFIRTNGAMHGTYCAPD